VGAEGEFGVEKVQQGHEGREHRIARRARTGWTRAASRICPLAAADTEMQRLLRAIPHELLRCLLLSSGSRNSFEGWPRAELGRAFKIFNR
jgi:hypothetical protein